MLIKNLIWDDWNIEHIAKHNVTPDEIGEVCKGKHFSKIGKQGTYSIIGQTQAGRYLTIILSPKGAGNFYTVTARDSDIRERRKFKKR